MNRGRRYINSESPNNYKLGSNERSVANCDCEALRAQVIDLQRSLNHTFLDLEQVRKDREIDHKSMIEMRQHIAELKEENTMLKCAANAYELQIQYAAAKEVANVQESFANFPSDDNVFAKLEAKIQAKKGAQKDKEHIKNLEIQLKEEKERTEKLKKLVECRNDRVKILQAMNVRCRNTFKSFVQAAHHNYEEMEDDVAYCKELFDSQDDITEMGLGNECDDPMSLGSEPHGPSDDLIQAINLISPEELRELRNIDFEDIGCN